jgi:EpsI family protein
MWGTRYLRILTLILLGQAALFYSASRGDSRPLAKPLKQFPQVLSDWRMAQEGVLDKNTLEVLKADDTMTRLYAKPGNSTGINLYIAYFETQQTGQTPHSPKNCLPGAGWSPSETGTLSISVPGADSPIRVNKYIVALGENKSMVLYWYQSHGRVVADEYHAKFYLVADSIRYHRSDEALVRIVAPVTAEGNQAALDLGVDFVKAAFPSLVTYFPM